MSRTLRVFLLAVALILGYGGWLRVRTPGFDEALAEILDGDADRRERLVCLGVLSSAGPEAARGLDNRTALVAAMAAVELEDMAGYRTLAESLRGRVGFVPGGGEADPGMLAEAALGEPYLRDLMRGHDAENRGDRGGARTLFERARRSAGLFRAPLAARLASEGLDRLR